MPTTKVYKKVVKFSFTHRKKIWVLVFSTCTWYLAYPMNRSFVTIFCYVFIASNDAMRQQLHSYEEALMDIS